MFKKARLKKKGKTTLGFYITWLRNTPRHPYRQSKINVIAKGNC